MLSLVRKSLELKIIVAMTSVIACVIGVYAYVDLRNMREDAIRTSERTLGAYASAIKGSVKASMLKDHHEDLNQILREMNAASFIDRVMLYNAQGRPRQGIVNLNGDEGLVSDIAAGVLADVLTRDVSDVSSREGRTTISYYAALENRQECFRCHGEREGLIGVLRVDFSLKDLDDLILQRRDRAILWSAVLIFFLVALLVLLLRVVVYRPVWELRNAMVRAAEGEASMPLTIRGQDELADLKRSFITMVDRISTLHREKVQQEVALVQAQDLAHYRNELHTMFDAMPDGVLMVDGDLRIVQSNRRVRELLPDAREGGDILLPSDGGRDEGPHRFVRSIFSNGGMAEHQFTLAHRDGTVRHLHGICAPVVEEGRIAFVVEIFRDITDRVRTEQELEEKTAELERTNRLLSRMAVTDGLTQLSNRRHFDEVLFKEIKRFNRRKYTSLSLLLIDIDHFKALNDRYGHLTGDTVLREIARILREEMRETDTAARYGGEEFAVVLPDTHLDGAGHKAEQLRQKVQMTEFPGHDEPVRVTISIGVANYTTGFPHDLVHAADKALYQAKYGGRNTVVVRRLDDEQVRGIAQ